MRLGTFSESRKNSLRFLLLGILLLGINSSAWAAWDWRATPQTADWKHFVKLTPQLKSKLWQDLARQGQSYETMAWEWRLGWIKACALSSEAWCSTVLQNGLFDRALVVRAETAARIGERFAGTGHQTALRLLSSAFAVQQNQRSQDPLYVQFRILHAIRQIGGSEGVALGEKLAGGSEKTARYWTLLAGQARAN